MRTYFVGIFLAALSIAESQAGTITLTLTSRRLVGATNQFEIKTNEVATVLASFADGVFIRVVKDGLRFDANTRTIVAGPARFVLESHIDDWRDIQQIAYLTVQITPESFPPDKTIVIPEGGGANIALECSTNLIDWATAPLGVYTNQPTVKFFRLKADRLP